MYLKDSKEEVKLGDIIVLIEKSPSCNAGYTVLVKVTKETLPELLEKGIIEKKCYDNVKKNTPKSKKDIVIPTDLEYYINKIAVKMNWNIRKVYKYLNTLNNIMPAAPFTIVLREIAIELDKKYKNHIENSHEIWVISLSDGKIHKLDKTYIKNYRNFAAFRTEEDAKFAYSIVKEIIDTMFENAE